MDFSGQKSSHHFHIPVMGTGFSIDTPLKVAKYGISSVISLVDDELLEQMRKFHCGRLDLQFQEIHENTEDARANRVTAYLDLIDQLVADQVKTLQSSPFESGSEITRYFEMLPDSPLKKSYTEMLVTRDSEEKCRMQNDLRRQAMPGSIDVNIMTKVDRDIYVKGEKLPPECSDAMSALRGYAKSSLRSSIIFSAGINTRVYGYLAKFEDFFPDNNGTLRKRIVLKVSDFRSAIIQGKYLAKRGLWVSEYRIESGLNCGGHAFATDGFLMGPILEEFGRKKSEMIDKLHTVYNKALANIERPPMQSPHEVRITVQGGIGTADENSFIMNHYGVDGTGWGTPFLLVPEVTNVDDAHIKKLQQAGKDDVYLSNRSPLGLPFWSLRISASEENRMRLASTAKPGSDCPKGFLVSDTEFTKVPICHASQTYQRRKLKQLDKGDYSPEELKIRRERVLDKSCLCRDLTGTVMHKLGIDKNPPPAICCGPNIVNFSKVATLEEMVSHIYGRISIMTESDRPHVFVRELSLYVDYLRREIQRESEGLLDRTAKYFEEFKTNLNNGIEYYQELAEQFSQEQKEKFLRDLDALFEEIENIIPEPSPAVSLGVI